MAELGDVRWRALRGEHDETVRRLLAQFGGHEVDHAGDSFLATFDSAGRAVRCALAIVSELVRLQLDVRAGVHTGEVEVVGDGISGIAVHIGARVAALGPPAGEVLVTRTVKDLTAGSGIEFESAGRMRSVEYPATGRSSRQERRTRRAAASPDPPLYLSTNCSSLTAGASTWSYSPSSRRPCRRTRRVIEPRRAAVPRQAEEVVLGRRVGDRPTCTA